MRREVLAVNFNGTKEEEAANLDPALEMNMDGGKEGEEKGGGGGWVEGTLLVLGETGFLAQEADLGRTMLIDARNVINKLIRLTILLSVRYPWPAWLRFAFNFYKH